MALYIGLMSGTSLDGIDASLAEITGRNKVRQIDAIHHPVPDELKQKLLSLMHGDYDGHDAIELMGECHIAMGLCFAEAVNHLLIKSGYKAEQIDAIGSHGQTIRHRPDQKYAFTLQIGDASVIAEETGITTVTDFRSRDMAAGGQGAPLVPAFHREVFSSCDENRCIINIGGMANVSYLPASSELATSGFDTGPGNVLIDYYCKLITNKSYDEEGNWARQGEIDTNLLDAMLADPYFARQPPKSTGREYFNADWLSQLCNKRTLKPEDIQRTLTELTAKTITGAIHQHYPETQRLIVCGGGARNSFLMERLQQHTALRVDNSELYQIDADWVEAMAFAWLAYCTLERIPANEPAVTGAHAPVILGAIYPA